MNVGTLQPIQELVGKLQRGRKKIRYTRPMMLHQSPVAHNTGHSATFSEWLSEFFIKLFTDERGVVLDPFMGSGTTYRIAAGHLGRVPIGIEINPKYIERAT